MLCCILLILLTTTQKSAFLFKKYQFFLGPKRGSFVLLSFLGRHHVCRPLDPTPRHLVKFREKEKYSIYLPFFCIFLDKMQLFSVGIFFLYFEKQLFSFFSCFFCICLGHSPACISYSNDLISQSYTMPPSVPIHLDFFELRY